MIFREQGGWGRCRGLSPVWQWRLVCDCCILSVWGRLVRQMSQVPRTLSVPSPSVPPGTYPAGSGPQEPWNRDRIIGIIQELDLPRVTLSAGNLLVSSTKWEWYLLYGLWRLDGKVLWDVACHSSQGTLSILWFLYGYVGVWWMSIWGCTFHFNFFRIVSLNLEVIDWLCWLDSEPPGPMCLYVSAYLVCQASQKNPHNTEGFVTQLSVWLIVLSLGTIEKDLCQGFSCDSKISVFICPSPGGSLYSDVPSFLRTLITLDFGTCSAAK